MEDLMMKTIKLIAIGALLFGFSNIDAQMMGNCMMRDSARSGMMQGGMMGQGMMTDSHMMRRRMNDTSMMKGMGPGMMEDMHTIHSLLENHGKIERRVKNIKNGVETWTESDDPEIAKTIKEHVWQMKQRMEESRSIRQMDPLFRELFKHHNEIKIQIEETKKGTHVIETSGNPEVVKLIQQHARTVSKFSEQGMQGAMQPTPLPEGYENKE